MIEFVMEISIEFMLASKIFLIIVSFNSVPIPKVPSSSSSLILTSVCKYLPIKVSWDTKISLSPFVASFLAVKKLILSPSLITTFPVLASVTSSEKFLAL